jgi:hypothetical protein
VLPQLGRIAGAQASDLSTLAGRVADFLSQFHSPLQLCYDSGFDKQLLVGALESTPSTASLLTRLAWVNISMETSVPEAQDAMAALFTEADYVFGLRQHHALIDARALKAAFDAYESR